MDDLSLHILDIGENSLSAGATRISIEIVEDTARDRLTLEITDNGRGMDPAMAARVADPFTTTRTTRRVGLGLSLLDAAARAANGTLEIQSTPGVGTNVVATFQLSHIDRKPIGSMAETIMTLIAARPDVELSYRHDRDGRSVHFSTEEVRTNLDEIPANSPETLRFIREYVAQEESSLITPS
jgi:sensor histidine kinase regulating citrate/malate metabolism